MKAFSDESTVEAGAGRAAASIMQALRIPVAKFSIGQMVCHRLFPFRGVIFDVDPEFDCSEEWYLAIPEELRPRKNQPFYHLFAENAESEYIAYVSEQNLVPDVNPSPVRHPQIEDMFVGPVNGFYRLRDDRRN